MPTFDTIITSLSGHQGKVVIASDAQQLDSSMTFFPWNLSSMTFFPQNFRRGWSNNDSTLLLLCLLQGKFWNSLMNLYWLKFSKWGLFSALFSSKCSSMTLFPKNFLEEVEATTTRHCCLFACCKVKFENQKRVIEASLSAKRSLKGGFRAPKKNSSPFTREYIFQCISVVVSDSKMYESYTLDYKCFLNGSWCI